MTFIYLKSKERNKDFFPVNIVFKAYAFIMCISIHRRIVTGVINIISINCSSV